jgi:hypothetical protein
VLQVLGKGRLLGETGKEGREKEFATLMEIGLEMEKGSILSS